MRRFVAFTLLSPLALMPNRLTSCVVRREDPSWLRAIVLARSDPESVAECIDEGTQAVVPDVQRHVRHGLTAREQAQRVDQPQLLAPAAEAHARVELEGALDGALAPCGRA